MRIRSFFVITSLVIAVVLGVYFLWANLKDSISPNPIRIITGSGQHRISSPVAVAVNHQGNVYVPDLENSQIIIFNASGDYMGQIGRKGMFGLPWDIVIDSGDNIFVVDLALHKVQKFDSRHNLLWSIGGEGKKEGQFNTPFALAVDRKDNLYVLDTGNSRIQVFDNNGKFIRMFGSEGTAEGKFLKPSDLDVAPDGRIFVVDFDNSRVQIFDSKGRFLAKFGQAGSMLGDLAQPKGISIDQNGMVYVSDVAPDLNLINVFDSDGNILFRFGGNGVEPGKFLHPQKSCVDKQGKLYISDSQNNRIQVITPVFHQGNYRSSECYSPSCHVRDKKYESKFIHKPVGQTEVCNLCHSLRNAIGIMGLTKEKIKKADVCIRCHSNKVISRYLHGPMGTGICEDCHQSHGAPYPNLLFEENEKVCYYCHLEDAFKKKFVHAPIGKGNCTRCHDPHGSEEKFLMRKPAFELCTECHGQFKFPKENYVHGPVAGGDCDACHDPHSADNTSLLKKEGNALCFICHTERIIAQKNIHQPLTEDLSAPKKGCLVCHSAHQSSNKFQLRETTVKLCFSCHEEKEEFDKKYKHARAEELSCEPCHNPHSSNNASLLKFKFSAERKNKFTDDSYELCFQCHLRSLITDKVTMEKTNFRDGNKNLHYVHVVTNERNCNLCHNIHSSDNKWLIRDFKTRTKAITSEKDITKFEFLPVSDGGSCQQNNCHAAYFSYSRSKLQ